MSLPLPFAPDTGWTPGAGPARIRRGVIIAIIGQEKTRLSEKGGSRGKKRRRAAGISRP
jgi:hypothetical protein